MLYFNDDQINQLNNLPHGGDLSYTLLAVINLIILIPLAVLFQFFTSSLLHKITRFTRTQKSNYNNNY